MTSFKGFAWIISFLGFLMLGAAFIILCFFNPQEAGWPMFFLLYLTIFLGAWMFFSLGEVFYKIKIKQILFDRVVNIGMRQGAFLSLILVFSLLLQSFRVLNWWTLGPLAVLAILAEFYIQHYTIPRQ